MAIWYILWSFGIYLPVLVFCTKQNLATLVLTLAKTTEDNLEAEVSTAATRVQLINYRRANYLPFSKKVGGN
jgi:hypothetical protein